MQVRAGDRWVGIEMIDWQRLDNLRQEIGPDDFSEVVALFIEEADEVVCRLAAATTAKGLESDLHFLKGSALNLGFTDLAQICQINERKAAAGDMNLALDQVTRIYAVSRDVFLGRLPGIAAA